MNGADWTDGTEEHAAADLIAEALGRHGVRADGAAGHRDEMLLYYTVVRV